MLWIHFHPIKPFSVLSSKSRYGTSCALPLPSGLLAITGHLAFVWTKLTRAWWWICSVFIRLQRSICTLQSSLLVDVFSFPWPSVIRLTRNRVYIAYLWQGGREVIAVLVHQVVGVAFEFFSQLLHDLVNVLFGEVCCAQCNRLPVGEESSVLLTDNSLNKNIWLHVHFISVLSVS